jgi:hypothetical protein
MKQLWWHMNSALRLVYMWLKIVSWAMVQRHSCKEYNKCRAVDSVQKLDKKILLLIIVTNEPNINNLLNFVD